MPTITPQDIKTNGEPTTFPVSAIPETEAVFHSSIVSNSVSRKPHHGENVVAELYLPPKLIVLTNNFPTNGSSWTFGTTLIWNDLKLWIASQFATQYSVTNINVTDIEIEKACRVSYVDNQKRYHCHVVVYRNNNIPNMYVSTETEHNNNLLIGELEMMQTYQAAENVFLPIGLPGQDAGWYMTFDSNGRVRPSTGQFHIPDVASFQVTNDYTNNVETMTIDKFRNKSLLELGTFVPGMDTDEIFTRRNVLPLTLDKVFYCPRNSIYRYRAKGTKEETLFVNEIPTAQVIAKTLTLTKTMQADSIVATGHNVFERPEENYVIEYADKLEIHVWYNFEILKIKLGDQPTQLINGNQLRYYSADADCFLDLINGSTTTTTQMAFQEFQTTVTLNVAVVFGCTLTRNIADIMTVETHNESYQEFEIREQDGYISYIYKKPVDPIVIDLGINYFDYRGLLAMSEFSVQDVIAFMNDSGFSIDPHKRFAQRVTFPTDVISLGETALAKAKRFLEIPNDVNTVLFTVLVNPLTLLNHQANTTTTFQPGTVSMSVDFFPFEYNNVLYDIRRMPFDSEGYSIVNVIADQDGKYEFPAEISENAKLIDGNEHLVIKMVTRSDGKLVVSLCTLKENQTSGFIRLKVGNTLMKYVITRQTPD